VGVAVSVGLLSPSATQEWIIYHLRTSHDISSACVTHYITHYITISYHIVVLKQQNRLKVGTDKPKLKVKMQSVSDDDVWKRLVEKPRFELAAKGVFRIQTVGLYT